MRIALDVGKRVMLAMHGDPLTGNLPGGGPDPEAEEMTQYRVQVDGAVRSVAMQVQRDRHHRDLHHDKAGQDVAPEAQIQDTVEKIEVHVHFTPKFQRGIGAAPSGARPSRHHTPVMGDISCGFNRGFLISAGHGTDSRA